MRLTDKIMVAVASGSKNMNRVGQNNLITREAWLEKSLLGLKAGESIIDVGAGELQYKKYCTHLKYTSQDFGGYDGSGDSHGFQMKSWDNSKLDLVSDIKAIPVANESFDNAMCIEVLEHVPDPVGSIREIYRIIKPGGKLIISAPFCSLTHFSPFFFYSGFSNYWYLKILTEAGFEINEISANGNYFEYFAQEFGRLPMMAEKYSRLSRIDKIKYRIIRFLLLPSLGRWSKTNNKSEEILCFGWQVVATKK